MAKMLISKYVDEDQKGIKLIARASNIAHWFTTNYGEYLGSLISVRDVRTEIVNDLNISPTKGDLKTHGRAVGLLGLELDGNHIEFSLINIKRCTSFLLGRGRISHGLTLIRDPLIAVGTSKADAQLIDQAITLDANNLTPWESKFTQDLDVKFRSRNLTDSQRWKLIQIIHERS